LSRALLLLSPIAVLALSGCLAKTVVGSAVGIVTAPVRVGAKAVDMVTTSQSEADENRGRTMRKRDDRIRKLQRQYNHRIEACNHGESAACSDASRLNGEIDDLRAQR